MMRSSDRIRQRLIGELRLAGCVAADEEADELLEAAGADPELLTSLLARRRAGEPLAWLTGSTRFLNVTVRIKPGVYVPRWQSEPLAVEAADRLPPDGIAVDLCTGAGALAMVMSHHRPDATVMGTELDPLAADCARANGVAVVVGDLNEGLPPSIIGQVDVVVGVVPYVPTGSLELLPRDVLAFEPLAALDGGADGLRVLRRAAQAARELLRPGGSLLLELGGDQLQAAHDLLDALGYIEIEGRRDGDGDVRAIVARRPLSVPTTSR